MKRKEFTLLIVLLCLSTEIRSQQQCRKFTLDELFRLADENSKSQQIHDFRIEEAQKSILTAKKEQLPTLNARLSVGYLGNGRIWDRDFSNGMKADIPHFGNNFALAASQIIYSGGAVSSGMETAEIAEKIAVKEKLLDKSNLRFLISGYYLELYKLDNQQKVYDKNIALTEELLTSVRTKYSQGTVLENDITRYELQKANYKLAKEKIENNRHVINYRLNMLVGIDNTTVVQPDTTFLHELPTAEQSTEWQKTAATSAHSIALSELGIQQSKQKERLVRSESLPKISIVAEEHLDGPVTIEVPALNKNFNYWFVGIGLNFNISSIYRNRDRINKARIETMRQKEAHALLLDELACNIENDYTHYREAVNEMSTLLTSVKLAQQNYTTVQTRYKNGLALATDMLEVSNSLLNAELSLANARANVQFAFYKLKHTSGTL